MNDIETTYLNTLGRVKHLDNHHPTYSRKRLKQKVLFESPHLKSVLQIDRTKSAVLYSPEVCDEDMMNIALSNDPADLHNMKLVYSAVNIVCNTIATFFFFLQ